MTAYAYTIGRAQDIRYEFETLEEAQDWADYKNAEIIKEDYAGDVAAWCNDECAVRWYVEEQTKRCGHGKEK